MREVTRQTLDQLCASDLFFAVGKPVLDNQIIQVANWRDAVKSQQCQCWEYWQLEMRNKLTSTLDRSDRLRYNATWKLVTAECSQTIDICIDKGLSKQAELEDRNVVRNDARWNIMAAIMETEYSDIIPGSFFSDILPWYLRGHCPCGWIDEYPQGRLV